MKRRHSASVAAVSLVLVVGPFAVGKADTPDHPSALTVRHDIGTDDHGRLCACSSLRPSG